MDRTEGTEGSARAESVIIPDEALQLHNPTRESIAAQRRLEYVSKLSPTAVGKQISWPVRRWPGNCHSIANAMLDAHIVEGRLCYGHYRGPIAAGTLFAGKPLVHHGWIEKPDGGIIDPTRYVFEGTSPYIYDGPNDGHYDEGGNIMRRYMEKPFPAWNPADALKQIRLPDPEARLWICGCAGWEFIPEAETVTLSMTQLFWLGNLSLHTLGHNARPIYEALVAAGHVAIIPIDNLEKVIPASKEQSWPAWGGSDEEKGEE